MPVPPTGLDEILTLPLTGDAAKVNRELADLALERDTARQGRADPRRSVLGCASVGLAHLHWRTSVSLESEERPWGSWHVIDDGQGYKVKRIHVNPGQRLSYQTHEHRSEHWVVIFGKATCVIDGETIVAGPGQSVDVPTGAAHRITNMHAEELVHHRGAARRLHRRGRHLPARGRLRRHDESPEPTLALRDARWRWLARAVGEATLRAMPGVGRARER